MSKVFIVGNAHIMTPNLPRNSQYKLLNYKNYPYIYIPERITQKIWRPLEGVNLLQPLFANIDLVHSFNAIVYTNKPWIVTFEAELPRLIGYEGKQLFLILRHRLALDNCKQIIAMSNFSKRIFLRQHESWTDKQSVINKLNVISPNFPIRVSKAKKYATGEILTLIFVGNDFARKGGIVALRVAEKAKKKNLPIKLHIISRMNYGPQVYTDCLNSSKYRRDLTLLELDNVVVHKYLPNEQVLKLLAISHFQIMCTLDDTYGFSILEGFSVGTPAITTNVGALPEFVNSNNGLVIDLEVNDLNTWIHLKDRKQPDYWSILDKTYETLANEALEFLTKIINVPECYEQLSAGTLAEAQKHDANEANEVFNNLYTKILDNN